jgi:hypothetical protein
VPKVFGYARVSSQDQAENGVSLAEQERRIRGRALEQGWTLEHIFVEEAVSGSIPLDERPQGSRLLRTVQPGDVVICAKLELRHQGGTRPFGYQIGQRVGHGRARELVPRRGRSRRRSRRCGRCARPVPV